MPADLEKIQKDLAGLKRDIAFIKHVLVEEYEMSGYAKKALKKARETPKSKYVSLEELG
ncbi:MAG: hypothetical protein HYY37_01170 [Candidatus Aenigmarchaeota archaeon]|nr:hypothetical protein [Candidatus Aenigmarchaeota archaeon]